MNNTIKHLPNDDFEVLYPMEDHITDGPHEADCGHDDWGTTMSEQRWHELETNLDVGLTDQEIKDGWHFCMDWDGMLVNKNGTRIIDHSGNVYRYDKDGEGSVCTCEYEPMENGLTEEPSNVLQFTQALDTTLKVQRKFCFILHGEGNKEVARLIEADDGSLVVTGDFDDGGRVFFEHVVKHNSLEIQRLADEIGGMRCLLKAREEISDTEKKRIAELEAENERLIFVEKNHLKGIAWLEDEIERLIAQDEVHRKTRRTLLKRIAELEARHAKFLQEFWKTNAENSELKAAACKTLAEQDALDEHHSAACMNCSLLEHSQHQCGLCDLREALASKEKDDE